MFRMSKREWLAQFFRPVFAERKPRAKREKAVKNVYRFRVPGYGTHEAAAHTRSEARALVKRKLFLDRLPVGTERVSLLTAA